MYCSICVELTIKGAVENVNPAIENFESTVTKLITVTNSAIEGVKTTSANSQSIKKSMEDLGQLAKDVEDMVIETNKVLQLEQGRIPYSSFSPSESFLHFKNLISHP